MLCKDDRIAGKQDGLVHNPLCKTLLMLFVIAWAILISKVYDKSCNMKHSEVFPRTGHYPGSHDQVLSTFIEKWHK